MEPMINVVWEPRDVWDIAREAILKLPSDLLLVSSQVIPDGQNIYLIVECLGQMLARGLHRRQPIQASPLILSVLL